MIQIDEHIFQNGLVKNHQLDKHLISSELFGGQLVDLPFYHQQTIPKPWVFEGLLAHFAGNSRPFFPGHLRDIQESMVGLKF